MFKKMCIVAILSVFCNFAVFAQNKPRLGILPFVGGVGGDGETIATLLSFQGDIMSAFTVVPRTSAVNALIAEQKFQLSGHTDSDTIARIGNLLNADFVVSGHIRQLGSRNLVITTIVNVETFEQMAGDYRTYSIIDEVRDFLPDISKKMIAAAHRNTSNLPRLAIAPFRVVNDGVNVHDAETLAQILTVEISNSGKFAVLPRTSTMQTALQELHYQLTIETSDEGAKALGQAINAGYVLAAEVRSLGLINMFTAQILHTEESSLLAGGSRDYQVVDDGIRLMPELAIILTDPISAEHRIAALNREHSRTSLFEDSTRFWSIGVSVGTSFDAPWITGTLRGTVAPFRHSFLELGIELGAISGIADVDYFSIYPFIHYALFLPYGKSGGWYAGAGCGYLFGKHDFPEGSMDENIFSFNLTTGVVIKNAITISYTLMTDFNSVGNKISVGYAYRFN